MPSEYEKRAREELLEEGWKVDVKWGMHRYSKWNDFFHVFDLFCIKGEKILLLSIKGKGGIPTAHKEEVEAFSVPSNVSKEIWARRRTKKRGKEHYWNKKVIK